MEDAHAGGADLQERDDSGHRHADFEWTDAAARNDAKIAHRRGRARQGRILVIRAQSFADAMLARLLSAALALRAAMIAFGHMQDSVGERLCVLTRSTRRGW